MPARSVTVAMQETVSREDVAACETILRRLPEWFGIETALVDYVKAIAKQPTILARSVDDDIVGFVSIRRHFDRCGEVHVMAVDPDHHRAGS